MRRNSIILLLLGAALVIGLAVATGAPESFTALAKAKPGVIALSLVSCAMSLSIRARKWHLLINETGNTKVKYGILLPIYLYNNLISNITPAKIGDFVGPLLIKKYANTSIGAGISAILVDRIVELFILTAGLLMSGLYFARHYLPHDKAQELLLPIVLLVTAIITGMIAVFRSQRLFSSLMTRLEKRNYPPFFSKLIRFVRHEGTLVYTGLKRIDRQTVFLFLIPLTLLAWICDIATVFFIFQSVLPMDLVYLSMTFFINVGISLISFIPLGLGAGELGFFYFLQMQGYDKSVLVVGILLARCLPLALLVSSGILSRILLKKEQDMNGIIDPAPINGDPKKDVRPGSPS